MSRRRSSQGGPGRAESQRGSAVLEFALVLPIVLALIGAVIDGGWALHQAAIVTAAAQAAQRAAALQDTGTAHCAGAPPAAYADVSTAAATAAAPTLNPANIVVVLRYLEPACTGRMRTLVADVTYPLRALTPWFAGLLNGRRLTAEAASAVEELPPPWWGSANQVQSDQAQIQAQQSEINAQSSQIASQQVLLASLQSQLATDEGQLAAQQADLVGDQSQIQTVLSAYQAASASFQAEVSLASALSQAAAYYYAQWLQFAGGGFGGTHEQ